MTNEEAIMEAQAIGRSLRSMAHPGPVGQTADITARIEEAQRWIKALARLISEARRLEKVRRWAETERDETGWSNDLHDGYSLAQEHVLLHLSTPDAETQK